MSEGPAQVVYITDARMLRPTLLSIDSLLAHARRPLHVIILSQGIDAAQAAASASVVAAHPDMRLTLRPVDPDWLTQATSPQSFIPPLALARMFLPRVLRGRVLYIDGDTLVRRDVGPLFDLDMGGRALAGVADYLTLRRVAGGRQDRLAAIARVMRDHPPEHYINSGVLLLDTDAIRALPGRQAAMEDMVAAAGYPTVDQDRLNVLFRGETLLLDPSWNASWGRLSRQRRDMRTVGMAQAAAIQDSAAILHFHGPHKPWNPLRLSQLARGPGAVLAYRAALRDFRRRFPV